jgi:hypothetical protein
MEGSSSERLDTLKFLVAEAQDGVAWHIIYSDKMALYDISPEEVQYAMLERAERKSQPPVVYPQGSSKTITLVPVSDFTMFPKTFRTVVYICVLAMIVMPALLLFLSALVSHCPPLVCLFWTVNSCDWLNNSSRFLLQNFYWLVIILTAPVIRLLLPPPTHLFIGPVGLIALRTVSKKDLAEIEKTMPLAVERYYSFDHLSEKSQFTLLGKLKWSSLASVSIDSKFRSRGAKVLSFHSHDGKVVKLKIGDLLTQEVREKLTAALKEWAPNVLVDQEVRALLEARPDVGYTELWISALSAPPGRERIAPLVAGTGLGDGKYEIDEQLGSGGQGTVYLARCLKSDGQAEKSLAATVAIKEYILPMSVTHEAKKNAIESLAHEARILQSLNHEQIVKCLDFFIEDHRGYLVFEHLQGLSLRALIQRSGAQSDETVEKLARQMCAILDYLHSQSPPLIHRDFTPDNLILTEDGQLKLIDFNCAQPVDNLVSAIVVGKRSYTPPEQLKGKAIEQSDIYALGATLYFLLTGEEPEPIEVAHPIKSRPQVSQRLDTIVAKCTQLSLENRYHSAKDIISDLTVESDAITLGRTLHD